MAQERHMVHITERELAVLANPLRGRLLALLRVEGPATASMLAKRIGESSGVTSYHLRKLAEVDLVAEEVDRGTRKERWWRSVHEGSHFEHSEFLGNRRAHEMTVEVRREWFRWQARLLDQALLEEEDWDEAWVDAANSSDDHLMLTPDQATAMAADIWDVVQRYRAEGDPDDPDAARVIWMHHLVPVFGELPL